MQGMDRGISLDSRRPIFVWPKGVDELGLYICDIFMELNNLLCQVYFRSNLFL